jgi:excisionase family DNA binding protein
MATKSEVPASERLAIPLTEGAKMIGVGLSYCYELMKAGKLKTFKIGRRRMVTRQALQNCIDAQQAEAGHRKVA